MNKFEKTAVALLIVFLVGWAYIQRTFLTPAAVAPVSSETNVTAVASNALPEPAAAVVPEVAGEPDATSVEVAPTELAASQPTEPEHLLALTDDVMMLTVSSYGGTVKNVVLKQFPETQEEDSAPVTLDFSDRPAFMLSGIPGLSVGNAYALSAGNDDRTLTAVRETEDGLRHVRTYALKDHYRVEVTDAFSSRLPEATELPAFSLALGPMAMIESKSQTRGISYLGLDTMPDMAGRDVTHWGKKKIPAMFGASPSRFSCARPNTAGMAESVENSISMPVAWAAAKNKYFVQIMAPEGGASDCVVFANRRADSSALVIADVAADLAFPAKIIQPGETYTKTYSYYAGPKKHSLLRELPNYQANVMQFGWWGWFRWVCGLLLTTLNLIYKVLPNYGVAIIILTIIVKVIFWPLTHKGTESAKRMQQLQPKIAELREKHKSQPQKLQQAQMALYKEHGVNPMASCLPMVVQLPIFIALFTVLRSAVELRFAGFLWISDLSEPEGLLATLLPIPLNILPIFMTVTMVLQQKLTPSAGDPQQQKMMMIMPVVMLFIFYNMASALVLYWSISQSLSILQLLHQRRKGNAAPAIA